MKTAISIPDDVFFEAEQLTRRLKRSRSQLYADAIREYLARHNPDAITEAWDRVCASVGDSPDAFVNAAAYLSLQRQAWEE